MKHNRQPDRLESSIIAAALAVAGMLFLSDKLGSLLFSGTAFMHLVQHTASVVLVALGLTLLVAEQDVIEIQPADLRQKRNRE